MGRSRVFQAERPVKLLAPVSNSPLVGNAREADATWRISAKALRVTEQGAQDYYHPQIAKQEEYVPEFPARLGPP